MATNPTSGNSGIGGATNSAPQPTYKCPYCKSTRTRYWRTYKEDFRDHFDRWLDPLGGNTGTIYVEYTCDDCHNVFYAEVKRLG